jgi:hypothetical protein
VRIVQAGKGKQEANCNSSELQCQRTAMLTMSESTGSSGGESRLTIGRLVGTWSLVSASSTTKTGERSETPYGPEPAGLLTYTEDGRVTALISYGGRKPLSTGGGTLAPMEEQAEAFRTFLAYAGRYTFSGDKVTHHIEISSIQNYVDRDLVRSVKFRGDQIVLVTPPMPVNGKVRTIELIWQRLPVDPRAVRP